MMIGPVRLLTVAMFAILAQAAAGQDAAAPIPPIDKDPVLRWRVGAR